MSSAQHASNSPDDSARVDLSLLLCLLNGVRLLHRGKPVELTEKATALLYVLASRGRSGMERDALVAALWPDREPRLAGRSLNTLVWTINRRLSPMTGSSHVISHRKEVYLLNEHAGIAVDIERFDALADAGDLHARQGNIDEAAQLYRRAAELYAGDLYLRSETDASQIIERERLRTRMERLLANVARWSYERQDIPACVAAAERVLLSDPYQEGMHRLLMRCHLAQGQRSLALRQYLTCKTLLKAEFNADPEAETTELFEFARSSRSARDASATGTKGCSYQVPGAAARLNLPGRTERFEK